MVGEYMAQIGLANIASVMIVLLALVLVFKGVKVVPQSEVYVIERFGKYTKTLDAGLNFIVPYPFWCLSKTIYCSFRIHRISSNGF